MSACERKTCLVDGTHLVEFGEHLCLNVSFLTLNGLKRGVKLWLDDIFVPLGGL